MGIITVNTDFEKLFGVTEREYYYSKQYLTFELLEDQDVPIYWSIDFIDAENPNLMTQISFSIDDGKTWVDVQIDDEESYFIKNIKKGDKILFKGNGGTYNDDSEGSIQIQPNSYCKVYGNIMSLIYGDDFYGKNFDTSKNHMFYGLFSKLVLMLDAHNLILPNNVTANCYEYMFGGCTSLTTAPELPATTLADSCYKNMFGGCTSLTTAPELPATTLAQDCYPHMFEGCTSLTTAPELPATTLANYCYQQMFQGCTSLTTAPELPATTLADSCYSYMFNGCTSLNNVKCHLTGNIDSSNTKNWLNNVAATGTFICDINSTWTDGASGIPTGWTKKYFNGPSLVMYVDKFPPQGDTGVGDFNYTERTGMTRDEYMEATVADPEGLLSDKYVYYGQSINIGATTYYVWKGVGHDNSDLFLLTTTADYDTLSAQSIAEEGDVPFTSMYALATSEDDEFNVYEVNTETEKPRQLVKIENYANGE